MRRRRKVAIDTHDVGELRGVVRRTRLVRLVLAAAAVAALLATVASARSLDVQRHTIVPSGSTGVIVVDVSLSIANSYGDVRRTLQNVVGGDAPVGLVVFSDVPYELFPPGTPASELRPVLRVLTPPERGEQPTPWTQSFRGGTRISEALELAGRMLRRAHVEKGSILLVSDLQTAPDDVADLTRTIEELKSRDVSVRVVPIGALSDGRLLFSRLLGRDAFSEPTRSLDNEARPLRSADSAGRPIGLLTLAALFFLALAAHERYASRSVHAEGHMRRLARILGALACFALAAVFVLVALDVARWDPALEAGDVRYRAAPQEPDLWRPGQIVPFGAARSLLGVDDDVDFREALRTLRLAGIAEAQSSDPRLALRRNEARTQIAAIAERDADSWRRSRAMTLLGVISFASALSDAQDQDALQRDALARFRGAIALEPDNDEAKANLEVALRRDAEAGESGGGKDPTPGGQGARGAGAGEAGAGY